MGLQGSARKVVLERSGGKGPINLDASDWNFVLLRYPDGAQELLLQSSNLPPMDEDERWQAAAVTLESILGEDILMDKIDEFQLVDKIEQQFAQKQKPIQNLREVVITAVS